MNVHSPQYRTRGDLTNYLEPFRLKQQCHQIKQINHRTQLHCLASFKATLSEGCLLQCLYVSVDQSTGRGGCLSKT
jgi:hypothetical protein